MNEIVEWEHKVPFTDYHDVLMSETWLAQLLCDAGMLFFVICVTVACILHMESYTILACFSSIPGLLGLFFRFCKISSRPCHAELWFCSEGLLLYYPRRYYTKHKALREAYMFRYDSLSRCVFHTQSKVVTLEGCTELYTYKYDKWNHIGDKCSSHKVFETKCKLNPKQYDYDLLVTQIETRAPVDTAEYKD